MGTKGLDSEKFRKQVTSFFAPKSSHLERTELFVPSKFFASEKKEKIRVENVEMSTSVDGNGVLHHYSITWREKNQPRKKTSDVHKLCKALKTGKVRCEGPCEKVVDMTSVVQFGCDHLICDRCRRSQTSTALYDGAPGCCNAECIEKAERDGMKLRSGRHSSASSANLRSNEGPWEVIQVHVSIIRQLGGQVYRTQLVYEFPSQHRVAELTNTLYPFKSVVSLGRTFYSFGKPSTCQDLHKISLVDTNLRFYHLPGYVPLNHGKMYVLVMGDGIQVY